MLIQTKSIGINPIDIQVRSSKDILGMITGGILPEHVILGWDVAGVVERVGEGVTAFKPGDEVYGLAFTSAGATPMSAMTAYQAVITLANIQKGDKVLIHAASGGVGHFAVQFAKERGAYVIGTASGKNEEFVRSLGVDQFLNYKESPFEAKVSNVDVVIDTINSVEHVLRSISVIKEGGRLVYLQPNFAEALSEKLEESIVSGLGVFVNSSGKVLAEISTLIEEAKLRPKLRSYLNLINYPTRRLQ